MGHGSTMPTFKREGRESRTIDSRFVAGLKVSSFSGSVQRLITEKLKSNVVDD